MTTKIEKPRAEDAFPRFRPSVDIYENESAFTLVLDLPGVAKEAVAVNIENDSLHVSAKRAHGSSETYYYERMFTIPGSIERDKIAASMKAGVLTLNLPKHESKKPKQVRVNAA